jgi:hypothetical protein
VIRVLELQSGKVTAELPLPVITQDLFVQFSADSKLLVAGDAYHARIWDVATWEEVNLKGGSTAGCGQYFTPQSELLAVISRISILFTYDWKVQELCGIKPLGAIMTYYFYDAHKIAFVLANGDFKVYHAQSVEISRIGSAASYPLPRQVFLAADQASGWYAFVADGVMNIENVNGGAGSVINSQDDYHYRVALLPGKKLMALGSRYGSIHIWTMP